MSSLFPIRESSSRETFLGMQISGALQGHAFGRSGNPRITLSDGEVFINGTHASNRVNVSNLNSNVVRVNMIGIDVRDFNIADVDSIRFFGRKGNDQFTNSTLIPGELFGHDGNDSIDGGLGADQIWGGFGEDVIYGRAGDDVIWGGPGDDIVVGNGGNDRLYGQAGNDVLYGKLGDDFISGANGDDEIYGNEGADTITGDSGNDIVKGGDGNDFVMGWTGNDRLYGQNGNDYVDGYQGVDLIVGGAGNDILYGGDGDDEIQGNSGNDFMNGGYGQDLMLGDVGDDEMRGVQGDDRMMGGGGHDDLNGGSGEDLLVGGGGKDNLTGGTDRDVLIAGNDNHEDTLRGHTGADSLLFFAGDKLIADSEDMRLKLVNKTASWTNDEMVVIAEAMDSLYQATGNNRLMIDAVVGEVLKLEKYSSLPGNAAAINYMTINTQNGNTTYSRAIRFADWDETNVSLNPWRKLAFIHEISHNFDDPFELGATPGVSWSSLTSFWGKSGWTQNPSNTTNYIRSGDGQWWYHKSAEFSRNYGKTNRYEDWGTMWEHFFNPDATPPEAGSKLASKLNSVKNFFSALS